jgi:uncharacterized membrane protein
MSTAGLFWGVLAGAVGAGYCLYGRRQRAAVPLLCGLALMVVPAVIDNTLWLGLACAALAALPFMLRD